MHRHGNREHLGAGTLPGRLAVAAAQAAAAITLAPEVAWKLFAKGLSPAVAQAHIMGDAALATAALHLVAVIG